MATKAFMKVHWRIVLAIFCTIGIFSMAFGGEEVKDRVGGSLAYLVAAIVFWTLHIRHSARTKPPAPIDTASAHRPELDLTVDDGWSQRLSDCQTKASVFNEVAAATKSEPVRLWLSNVSDDIEAQLATADDLATLGRSVEPSFDGNGEPQNAAAREAWTRLATFESGLDEAITSAAHVRLNSASPNADMDAIHSQLAMLREQLPTLESP
ncbi:hypothetical protein HWD35_21485 [Tsukamurella tyrosinosolvens]|uniref:hypothetical protein n=1 Tax=Tsukamurella tyrosinosolvens TaxID=57704 RepID=UPI001CE14B14|nr:hypothetical protein [Tsukamurella tyrosinosolvens]MCA4997300.1 hypothetical protein [Tsukamurella tyrosinosolvens]